MGMEGMEEIKGIGVIRTSQKWLWSHSVAVSPLNISASCKKGIGAIRPN